MINKIYKYFLVVSLLIIQSCAGFEPVLLDHSNQIAVEEDPQKGIPILQYNKGTFDDFKGEIYSWWPAGNDQLQLSRTGDTLKVVANNVGSKYTPFGRQFPPIDFTEAPVLRIRARCEGKLVPTIRIDLKDVNGYTANQNPPSARIKKSGEYIEYYFNFKDKWKQSYPDTKNVDPVLISDIMLFINPGAADWTGTLYIDEIKAVRVEDIPSKTPKTTTTATAAVSTEPAGMMIDNFDEAINTWWAGDKYTLERTDNNVLMINANGVGPGYDALGRAFPSTDFNTASVIRVKARAEGTTEPELRIDIKDNDGRVTNAKVTSNKIAISNDFKDYFFNYKGKFTQGWPDAQKVNAAEILEIVLFVNGGKSAFTGKIYIDEIEIVAEKTGTVTQPANTNTAVTPAASAEVQVIDDFSQEIYNWWGGSDKIKLEREEEVFKVTFNGAGPTYETFGRGFPMVDFTKTPVVKIKAKISGEKPATLRIDIKDSEGITTNTKAVANKIIPGTDFTYYYFDFTDKYEQSWPNAAKVKPQEIVDILFFVNPGGEAYTGVLYIDEITVISLEDFKNKK